MGTKKVILLGMENKYFYKLEIFFINLLKISYSLGNEKSYSHRNGKKYPCGKKYTVVDFFSRYVFLPTSFYNQYIVLFLNYIPNKQDFFTLSPFLSVLEIDFCHGFERVRTK